MAIPASRLLIPSKISRCCWTAALRSLAAFGAFGHRPTTEKTRSRKVIVLQCISQILVVRQDPNLSVECNIAIVKTLYVDHAAPGISHGRHQCTQFLFRFDTEISSRFAKSDRFEWNPNFLY